MDDITATRLRSTNHETCLHVLGIDVAKTLSFHLQDTNACPKPKAKPKYITHTRFTTHGINGNASVARSRSNCELFDRHDLVKTHIW